MKTIAELIDQYPEPIIENAVRIFVRYFSQIDLDHSQNFSEDEYVDLCKFFDSQDPESNNNYIAMQIIDMIHSYLAYKNNLGIIKSSPSEYKKFIEFKERELAKMLGFTDEEYDSFIRFQLIQMQKDCGLTRYDVCGFEPDLL